MLRDQIEKTYGENMQHTGHKIPWCWSWLGNSNYRHHHYANSVFRNLIALEQCYPDCGIHFTSYAIFMDRLTASPKDVEILKDHKIIEQFSNNLQVTPFFKNVMCMGLSCDWKSSSISDPVNKMILYKGSSKWIKFCSNLMSRISGISMKFC